MERDLPRPGAEPRLTIQVTPVATTRATTVRLVSRTWPACAYCRERVRPEAACSRCGAATCAPCFSDHAPVRPCPTLGCPGDGRAPVPSEPSVPHLTPSLSGAMRDLTVAARALVIGTVATLAIIGLGVAFLGGVMTLLAARSPVLLGVVVATLALVGGPAALGTAWRRR